MRVIVPLLFATAALAEFWDVETASIPSEGVPIRPPIKTRPSLSAASCQTMCTNNDDCMEAVYSDNSCKQFGAVVTLRLEVSGASYFKRDRGDVFVDCVGQELYDDMCKNAKEGITTCAAWLGDGTCDGGFNLSDTYHQVFLNCAEHSFDDGDCGSGSDFDATEGTCGDDFTDIFEPNSCAVPDDGVTEDCWGQVFTDAQCAVESLGVTTCAGWQSDGDCDGGQTMSDTGAIPNFNCAKFSFDGGDCASSPVESPTPPPTDAPTDFPTQTPTEHPTALPTPPPTKTPTGIPTQTPTEDPTSTPTGVPTQTPTEDPTGTPTERPTEHPTSPPTGNPTKTPTERPTDLPTEAPTENPTKTPTERPTDLPTESPTENPTNTPTEDPTLTPTLSPPTPTPTETPCTMKRAYNARCRETNDGTQCKKQGCKWKKKQCKPEAYKKGKTKKIKCKKLDKVLCACYDGCSQKKSNGVIKKCKGKHVFKESKHGSD